MKRLWTNLLLIDLCFDADESSLKNAMYAIINNADELIKMNKGTMEDKIRVWQFPLFNCLEPQKYE